MIQPFCCADWAVDRDDSQSASEVAIFLDPTLVSWWPCSKQLLLDLVQK